jgi:hypothetical protein
MCIVAAYGWWMAKWRSGQIPEEIRLTVVPGKYSKNSFVVRWYHVDYHTVLSLILPESLERNNGLLNDIPGIIWSPE